LGERAVGVVEACYLLVVKLEVMEEGGRTEEKTLPEFEQVEEGEVCSGAEEEG